MERFVMDETTNTLVIFNHHMSPKRLYYLVISHQYNGKIDRIGAHCFDDLIIPFLCIEDGLEYLEDRACENTNIPDGKLTRGLKMLRKQQTYGDSPSKESAYH